MATQKKKQTSASSDPISANPLGGRAAPLVFVSHDTRDADLAEAFDNLLTDASGGVVKTFRSSDRKGQAGIEYGADWYPAIMTKLSEATDVVALLTPNSVDRPWILYEAGVAKGKLNGVVFGIAIGVPLQKASVGPFAQFQNSADDEDSLTKLVLQLITRNPDARPREEAVRRQVAAFIASIAGLTEKSNGKPPTTEEMDATAVAKLFEEVKVMFHDLPQKVEERLDGRRDHFRPERSLHPRLLDQLIRAQMKSNGDAALTWLFIAAAYRDRLPWFYELAMEVYHAMRGGRKEQVDKAVANLTNAVQFMRDFPLEWHDRWFASNSRHLPELVSYLSHMPLRTLARKPSERQTPPPPPPPDESAK